MPSDITRTSDDVRQKYGPPVMQQGRVILDRDFNALQQTLAADIAAETLDAIGPCGTPDNGFQIMLQPPGGSTALWEPVIVPSSPLSEAFDFYIGPGTMYVGGQRAVFPAHAAGQSSPPGQPLPVYYSYNNQPDWLTPAIPPAQPQQEAISLLLHEQEVSAVEDPDLLDAALGGPDTTQRLRLMRRIERTPGNTCSAPADAWAQRGYQLDPKTMRLLPQVKLQVGFIQSQSQKDPCDPVAAGGFLGAFNQLIRIKIRNGKNGSPPMLLWSYDNASFIYRVTPEFQNATAKTLTLAQSPVDVFHQPAAGQVVEILRTTAVLADDPDNTDPTHQKKILRCIAAPAGFVTTLSASYDPTSKTVELTDALPDEFAGDPQLFLRVWQSQAEINSSGQPIPLNDFNNATTGLQVTLTLPDGATEFSDGAFWMIAVRPATPQAIYPERFLIAPQAPDGPRLWLCPLAVIDSSASPPALLQDCRSKFCNLVGLTKRERASCCKFRVGDGVETFGDFTSIQTAIQHLPPEGGEICVLAGRYFEYISLAGLTDVIIHGCGAETRIASPALQSAATNDSNAAVASQPVISIQNCSHIELRSFVVETATDNIGISIGSNAAAGNVKTPSSDIALRELIVIGTNDSGVFMQGNSLRLERSIIAMQNVRCDNPAVFAAGRELCIADNWIGQMARAVLPEVVQTDYAPAIVPIEIAEPAFSAFQTANFAEVATERAPTHGGIQIGGFSVNVEVSGNEILGGFGNGITLGSVLILSERNQVTPEILIRKFRPAPDPCAPGNFQLPPNNPYGPVGGRWVIEGPLENIFLKCNRIRQMGMAGIGPVGFFDLATTQEVVTINHLFILQNEIVNCPNERVGQAGTDQSAFAGNGGIVLPDVSDLIIRDNQVIDFGASWIDPVSGIFVLHGEQIEISRNHIVDSRNWSNEISTRASDVRAGIYISMVTPPPNVNVAATTANFAASFATFEGLVPGAAQPAFYAPTIPALAIVDNVVKVPLGRTLFAMGAGAFSIRGNSFATAGLAGVENSATPIGIMVINLGIPIDPFSATVLEALEILSALLAKAQAAQQQTDATVRAPASLANLGPGPVLFSQNRCCVDLSGAARVTDKTPSLCSTLIVSLDDVGFHDNQCTLISGLRQVTVDVLLLACSLRATGNRVQEIPKTTGLSLLTAGFKNITALNIVSNNFLPISQEALNVTNVNLMNF